MTDEMKQKLKEVEEVAKAIYLMVDRVKGSSESTNPKAPSQESSTTTPSGYDKFKQSKPHANDDPEYASLVQAGYEADGIDPADIPFN